MFRSREKKQKLFGRVYRITEYQCPACKRWFNSSDSCQRFNEQAVKMHITIWAKKEPVAKMLGEISKTPHFNIWRKYTDVVKSVPRCREWVI